MNIKYALMYQAYGMIPVLSAPATGSPRFYDHALVPKMLEIGSKGVFEHKIALGVHDYGVGHPVGDLEFESAPYPYDDVNQNGRPLAEGEFLNYGDVWTEWGTDNPDAIDRLRSMAKNPGQELMDRGGASSVLSAQYLYNLNVKGVLPASIPVLSTEGGISGDRHGDQRYPRTNPRLRAERERVLAKRRWHDLGVDYHYPEWYFCQSQWLSDGSGSQWPNDGWLIGVEPATPEYQEYFEWHKANAKNMNYLYGEGEQPEPEPEPEEPPMDRELDLHGLDISITDADVSPGDAYWHAQEVQVLPPKETGGQHNIFVRVRDGRGRVFDQSVAIAYPNVEDPDEVVTIVTEEKPADELGDANFPMYAEYDPDEGETGPYHVMVEGKPSDIVGGLGLPEKQHVSVRIVFERAVAEPAEEPEEPSESLRDALLAAVEERRVLHTNPDAALQKHIYSKELVPVTEEFRVTHDGTEYAVQGAESLHQTEEGEVDLRAVYTEVGQWNNVQEELRALNGEFETPEPVEYERVPALSASQRIGHSPEYVIIHSTGGPRGSTPDGTINYLRSNPRNVSTNVLVLPGQRFIEMVRDQRAAHHAGYRTRLPDGRSGAIVNLVSIGIEGFQVQGSATDYEIVHGMARVAADKCREWDIPVENVLAHREIDVANRRSDPVGVDNYSPSR